jgi:RNA polymerase subunit RPABC4/transcription elongation factor Spt4
MRKLKVCKNCGLLINFDDSMCKNCEKNLFDEKYKGFIFINNTDSQIAKKLDIKKRGFFAIRY